MEKGEAVRLSNVAAGGTPLHDDLQQAPVKIPGLGTSAGKVVFLLLPSVCNVNVKLTLVVPLIVNCFLILNLSRHLGLVIICISSVMVDL